MKFKNIYIGITCLLAGFSVYGQDAGHISGNVQIDFQTYKADSLIGAEEVPEKLLMNGFANVNYTKGNFSAGLRYESYLNPMLGFDRRYKGSGIMYRYASYSKDDIDITVGNFYEQFGSGLILRAYEERNLGYDNAFDGVSVTLKMVDGLTVKGLIGKQRNFFTYGPGIVRGLDAELVLNEINETTQSWDGTWIIGGSFVSKFEEDQDPFYKLPLNVASFAGRLNYIKGGFDFYTEYAYKINDPSTVNGYIYKPGEALLTTLSYSRKGLGVLLGAKRIDNMNYRSDRTATVNSLMINYLPALTKQHTYTIAAFYPYATQPNGEIGFQGEIFYKIPKGSKLGGKYGTQLSLNVSAAYSIEQNQVNDTTAVGEAGTLGYSSPFFAIGDSTYFKDINLSISRKINKKLKLSSMFMIQSYNREVIEGKPGFLKTRIAVLEAQYKISSKKSVRVEAQGMFMKKHGSDKNLDQGNWALGLVEYTIAPHYFFALQDLYNYGNKEEAKRVHYLIASAGYVKGTSRIALNYGKQRAGIFCVGGVCREVPASNGFSVSITSSF